MTVQTALCMIRDAHTISSVLRVGGRMCSLVAIETRKNAIVIRIIH